MRFVPIKIILHKENRELVFFMSQAKVPIAIGIF